MHNHGVVVRVACRLHNVCVAEFGEKLMQSISHGAVQGFEAEMYHQQNDARSGFVMHTDGVHFLGEVTGQIWSAVNIENCGQISSGKMVYGLICPLFSKYNKTTVRN
jgi:hypothetical protein